MIDDLQDDETLQQIRRFVFAKVEHSVATTEDAFRHEVKDLLPLYLLFKIIDCLEVIDSRLEAIGSNIGDFWNSRYNH